MASGRWQITLPDGRAGFVQRGFNAQPERRQLRMQERALLVEVGFVESSEWKLAAARVAARSK
jgi:hypothetical protein